MCQKNNLVQVPRGPHIQTRSCSQAPRYRFAYDEAHVVLIAVPMYLEVIMYNIKHIIISFIAVHILELHSEHVYLLQISHCTFYFLYQANCSLLHLKQSDPVPKKCDDMHLTALEKCRSLLGNNCFLCFLCILLTPQHTLDMLTWCILSQERIVVVQWHEWSGTLCTSNKVHTKGKKGTMWCTKTCITPPLLPTHWSWNRELPTH